MKFYCVACSHAWSNLDSDPAPPQDPLKRSCPACMKKAGYRWTDIVKMEYVEILEAA